MGAWYHPPCIGLNFQRSYADVWLGSSCWMPVELHSASDTWCVESIRTSKGISLEEIAMDTKLKLSTLRAIETGDFGSLPGGIYSVSYIRQYARAIGADEASLVEFYQSATHQEESCQQVRQLLQTRPPRRAL